MKNSSKVKAGMLLMSLGMAAGATAALILLQKKREEEVYHEAELKAMDELEQMMRDEADCQTCSCAEECATADTAFQQQAEAAQQEEDPAEDAAEDEE